MWRWAGCSVLLPGLLMGCGVSEQQIAQASTIRVNDDQFLPYREYTTGGVMGGNPLGFGAGIAQKNLAARVDRKTGYTMVLLQFALAYSNPVKRGYESASNAQAQPLKVVTVTSRKHNCSRKEDTCSIYEVFQIELPQAELRQTGADGYPIKLFARAGEDIEIAIPKVLITSLFAKVDADKSSGAPAATAAKPDSVPGKVSQSNAF